MGPKDIVILAIIILILGAAAFYTYRAKKSGKKCIGCPDACNCSKAQKSACGCGDKKE